MKVQIPEELKEVEIHVGNDKVNVRELLLIREEEMSHEFATHASTQGYWSAVLARLEFEFNMAKAKREQEYADSSLFVRDLLENSGIKVTEGRVDAEIKVRESYKEALSKEIETKYMMDIVAALVRSLSEKGTMLVSLGADVRRQLEMYGSVVKSNIDSTLNNPPRRRIE